MVDVDYIMDLIDWNKDISEQSVGIKLAQNVQSINVFLQPCNKKYNKNVWENCAEILSERSDEELSPYLTELLKWLQDMNWPGAFCILDRLKRYKDDRWFKYSYDGCFKCAVALDDEVWQNNLKIIERT